MGTEDSPSLEVYKEGIPANLPDPEAGKKNFRKVLIGLGLVLVVLFSAYLLQQNAAARSAGQGSISGIVVSPQGQPLAGAEIFLSGSDAVVLSGADGRFLLEGVPAGEVAIIVAYQYIGQELRLTVEAGETVDAGTVTILPNLRLVESQ